jgi:hypothetical protein
MDGEQSDEGIVARKLAGKAVIASDLTCSCQDEP